MADRTLFGDLSVTVHSGDRLGVVGINGTGKSTLLRVLAGRLDPDSGAVRQGRGVRTAFLDQAPTLPPGTVRDAVGSGWEAAAALDRLGMAAHVDRDVSDLSGGQAKRVALARVLAAPERAAGARRAHQPPRPARRGLARGLAGRLCRRPRHRVARPLPPRPGHHPHARARPRRHLPPRGRLRLLPRGQGRARGAGRLRRGDPPQPRPHRAGVAAARRQGPQSQATGPGDRGEGTHRPTGGRGGASR